MLNKHQVDTIDKNDPWARDKLKRKAVAEYLTPLLASIRQPFVISLHSPYGTGKSFFLECWKADLEMEGYKVVLFDAWASDFSNDPLSAFISSIKKQLSNGDSKIEKKFDELAKRTGGFLRSKFLPLVLKSASRKLIGDEGIEEFLEDIGANPDEVSDMLGSVALEALATQEMAEDSMRDFREFLAETVKEIVVNAKSEDHQKLIIFVDELDRCKPSYAIEVLESIKHLFAVRGTVFVLAFDETQMKDTIANTYGFNDGGEGYLRKFIDWQFQLPEPELPSYSRFLLERLFGDIDRKSREYALAGSASEGVLLAAVALGLTSRELERAMTHTNMLLRMDQVVPYPLLLGIMTAVYARNRDFAHELVTDFEAAYEFVQTIDRHTDKESVQLFLARDMSSDFILSYFLTANTHGLMTDEGPDDMFANNERRIRRFYSPELDRYYQNCSHYCDHADQNVAAVCLEQISGAAKVLDLSRRL
ncbi:KAP family P-loop NTPase fold protein [Kordiimonas sp.]|uniref:KAP family P-loop NTPase fold protein n=1 Tax=Kordiimonas sp. TaxID=1970157 RepID=UPI003A924D93